jgi:hypothetical protein
MISLQILFWLLSDRVISVAFSSDRRKAPSYSALLTACPNSRALSGEKQQKAHYHPARSRVEVKHADQEGTLQRNGQYGKQTQE